MALLNKFLFSKKVPHLYRIMKVSPLRAYANESHWYPDFKPGPYPKTKEERDAAAKKYNLLPEEYEPFPDDGDGSGDYPKLPFESVDSKDPYYPWDVPEFRRDYMETVPREMMILVPEGLSTSPPYDAATGTFLYLTALALCGLLFYGLNQIIIDTPVAIQQMPAPGVQHYTFELDHSKKH